jgi:serine protease Do
MRRLTNNLVAYLHHSFRALSNQLGRYCLRRRLLVIVGITASIGCLLIYLAPVLCVYGQNRKPQAYDPVPLAVPEVANLSTPFSRIAKEVGPAVVNINTEILPHAATPGDNGGQAEDNGDDDSGQPSDQSQQGMQNFFRQFFGGGPKANGPRTEEERALGSGFIVDPHGYIVTNDHVIDKADRIYVKLTTDPPNDQGHRATVVGFDKDTDLAVIKVDVPYELPVVKLGNSDAAQVGDSVEAIGSPFDLSQTVTAGIVSAKNRDIELGPGGQFKHYIQTDAAINPGNSGGPLLNMAGQVIGVNTAYFTQANAYVGIGFALPSNTVVDVYNQLIGPKHEVVRGSIGISYQPRISSAVAAMYNASHGVLISTVSPGKAADKAGLKPNDVIISIDGQAIDTANDLVDNLSARRPGTMVMIGFLRAGAKMTTRCAIDDRKEIAQAAGADPVRSKGRDQNPNPGQTKLGVSVSDLPDDAPSELQGVVILSVKPGSFADELDPPVGKGVVIEAVNRTPIRNKAEFDRVVSQLKSGDNVVLQVAYPNGAGQTALTGATLP